MNEVIQYKGYNIERETDPWALKYRMNFRYYCDENINHAETIEEAKDEISERVMCSLPRHEIEMNGRVYPFEWIDDAIRFAVMWGGQFATVINP